MDRRANHTIVFRIGLQHPPHVAMDEFEVLQVSVEDVLHVVIEVLEAGQVVLQYLFTDQVEDPHGRNS